MEQVSYNLRLDLKDTGIVNTGFRLKQGDSGMKISVSIFNRGVNVFDSTTVPKIVFKRPDGASVMANMTVGSSVYEYVFVGNELQQPGVEIMDVKFTLPNDRRESTVSCSFVVVPDTITPNTHGSDIYDNDLAELVAEATAAAETVEEVVGDSEAWAVGERNGVPVGPEDPAYHNNSKYWSEQANVTSLAALTDVDLNNPTDEDGLVYNGISQKWKNVPIVTQAQNRVTGVHQFLYNRVTSAQVVGGLTITPNADGSFTVGAGTATSNNRLMISGKSVNSWNDAEQKLPIGKYYASCEGATADIYLRVMVEENNQQTEEKSATDVAIEVNSAPSNMLAVIQILPGAVVPAGGITLKPLLRLQSDSSKEITPYAKTNRELTEDVKESSTTVSLSLSGNSSTKTIYKWGKVCEFPFQIGGSSFSSATGFDLVGTVPDGYRPKQIYTQAVSGRSTGAWASATQYHAFVTIETNGKIYLMGKASDIQSCLYFEGTLSYLTN